MYQKVFRLQILNSVHAIQFFDIPFCWQAEKFHFHPNALNKTFMGVNGSGQPNRFLCILNYGTEIVSLKKSQSAANIWNFP